MLDRQPSDGVPMRLISNISNSNINDLHGESELEPSMNGSVANISNKLSNNAALLNFFTVPNRSGDGSNPLCRYEAQYQEYTSAFKNLIDEDGKKACDINLHALNCCLLTYQNNMNEIYVQIKSIRDNISKQRDNLLTAIKRGFLPAMELIMSTLFKTNPALLSYTKRFCVNVIQLQLIKAFMFSAITADPDDIVYKPQDHPDRIHYEQFVETMEPHDPVDLGNQLRKFLKGMVKTGAAKFADIMMPQD
jgi:hypothetical protein